MRKKTVVLSILISVITILIISAGFTVSTRIKDSIKKENYMLESTAKLTYEVIGRNREDVEILIKITDDENGLEKIEYLNDNHIENCYGAKTKARDYVLPYNIEYKVKITSKNGSEKIESILIDESEADIYVATTGDDITGDGTVKKPYATLAKAITMASDRDRIYIFPGTYNLNSMYNFVSMIRKCIFRNIR